MPGLYGLYGLYEEWAYVDVDTGQIVHDERRRLAWNVSEKLNRFDFVILVPLHRIKPLVFHVNVAKKGGTFSCLDHAGYRNLK